MRRHIASERSNHLLDLPLRLLCFSLVILLQFSMPSRLLLQSPPPPSTTHSHRSLLLVVVAAASLFVVLVAVLILLYRLYRLRRAPVVVFPPGATAAPLRRFSYRSLHSATSSFHPSRTLGRGSSASVFRGILPDGKSVAVKRLLPPVSFDEHNPFAAGGSTDDQEFYNELQVLGALRPSPHVVSLLGYCLEGRRRRLLVYEYMPNGSLQEALFGSRLAPGGLSWDRRFSIVLDVAKALAFLHLECDPPVVHGDIKPSNVLLGSDFQAKICDFGLSRLKTVDSSAAAAAAAIAEQLGPEFFSQDLEPSQELWKNQDLLDPEMPPPMPDFAFAPHASSSIPNNSSSPKGKETAAPAAATVHDDNFSNDHGGNTPLEDGRSESNSQWGKEWWWKQDGSGELSSKDYVTEWIGSQIGPPGKADWDEARTNTAEKCFEFRSSNRVENLDAMDGAVFVNVRETKPEKKHGKKKSAAAGSESDRKMREWWKEEYFAEISKKSQFKKERNWFRTISGHGDESSSNTFDADSRTGRDMNVELSFRRGWRKSRSRSVASDMFSGEFFSRELSSTTSMRGTVCYVAPECNGSDHFMEKSDIYSFGVLILVIVSGRRPLHVLSSPIKLEKANLVSWCRQLAHSGNVLELVDESLKDSYSKEQASLCINLALLCLQRLPELRPDSGDILKILTGEMEVPAVPFEPSPSPPGRPFGRSRRKGAADAD